MINFKQLELSDQKWMRPITEAEDCQSADFNFASNYFWSGAFKHMVARIGDRFTIKVQLAGITYYSFPIGTGDLGQAMEAIRQDAKERNIPLKICAATKQHIEQLHACGISDFTVQPMTDANDYIYNMDDLADLKGKKYHGKRNHIHKFEQTYQWWYEQMRESHIEECRRMLKEWYSEHDSLDEGLREEAAGLEQAFAHFKELQLIGGVLYADEELVAFTIGDIIGSGTIEINFEKARRDIQGAYPMINREFVRMIRQQYPNIRYVNREDDMGNENLRKAKRSYHPVYMIEKHNLIFG